MTDLEHTGGILALPVGAMVEATEAFSHRSFLDGKEHHFSAGALFRVSSSPTAAAMYADSVNGALPFMFMRPDCLKLREVNR
jgi:hypothetical protein